MNSYLRCLGLIGRMSKHSRTSSKLLQLTPTIHGHNPPCRLFETASSTPQGTVDALNKGYYFVALPEIPEDTPKDNEALRIPCQGDQPTDFSKIDFEKCYLAVNKTIGEFETLIEELDFTDDKDDLWKDPKKLFQYVENGLHKMDSTYQLLNLMWLVKHEEFRPLNKELPQRYSTARKRAVESEKLLAAIENLSKRKENFDKSVQKIIAMYIQESKPFGREVTNDSRALYERSQGHLKDYFDKIKLKHHYAMASFTHMIDDPDILEAVMPEFSESDSTHHKSRTPLQVNVDNSEEFIKLCPDSDLRRTFYRSLKRLCSPMGIPSLDVYKDFENVRQARSNIALTLRERCYFDLTRINTQAQSQDLVLRTIDKLNQSNLKTFKERLNELTSYATSANDDNYDGEIEEGDLEYWIHKFKKTELLGCSSKQIDSNFPLENVIQGILDFLRNYFQIHVQELSLDKAHLWGDDVRMYQVSRNNQDLGTFYYDPYSRERRPFVAQGRLRGRSNFNHSKPSLFLSHQMRKDSQGPVFMSQNQIKDLFYGIGLILQELLWNEEFYELNIRGPFKVDSNQILPNLFVTWLYRDPRILQSCSYNRQDGQQISLNVAKKIIKSMTYFNCVHNADCLYKSHLDIEFNTTSTDANKIAQKLYSVYKPYSYDTTTYHFCSDLTLIGLDSSIYYRKIWSKLIATECFGIYQAPKEASSLDFDIIKQTSDRIITAMFDVNDDRDLLDKLAGISGDGFKFAQPSLGVL